MKPPQRTEAERIAGTLFALADRCEAATVADDNSTRHLGREVLLACGKGFVSPLYAWLNPILSFDAAIKLIPKEADSSGEVWRAEAYSDPGVLASHVRASAWVAGAARVFAATPAAALCAAALRSRAHLLSQEQTDER